MTGRRDSAIRWLLDSDPAIRWQVMRDLVREAPDVYEAQRARISQVGWGRRLLEMQDADGLWGNSLYNGKWTSTTYSLYLLKVLGLAPQHSRALVGCARLIEGGLYDGREIRFSRVQAVADLGVTALVVSICSYFGWPGEELPAIAKGLLDRQRPDGSWRPDGAGSASEYEFETTLLAVEALLQFQRRAAGHTAAIAGARRRGWRFLLDRRLGFEPDGRSKRAWASFSFPPYWYYDYLTALDCLRDSGGDRDHGAQAAIDLLGARRKRDGRWGRGAKHVGRTYFDLEAPGQPSRWNTLRAMRVLEWWDDPAICCQPTSRGA